MARQQVHSLMEILAKDINAFRKTADKTLLDVILSNALPRLPAFIGGGFRATLSGSDVEVASGICFQEIDQTDGSANTRIAHLETDQTLSINLPASGTKTDLIECRSILTDLPTENRRFNEPSGIETKATVIENKWSAEVRVRENVVANADGGYDAASGWVGVALVTSNSSGIVSIVDHRNYFNLFDPDFFSVYGRKNINLVRPYDGVNLIEIPFEFSDLVSKLSQVEVRRITKERYGASSVSQSHDSGALALTPPVGMVSSLKSQSERTFLGYPIHTVELNVRRRSNSFIEFDRTGSAKTDWVNNNNFGAQSIDTLQVGIDKTLKTLGMGFSISSSQFDTIPTTGFYVLLSTSEIPTLANSLIWNIPKSHLVKIGRGVSFEEVVDQPRLPIYGSATPSERYRYFQITTVNPVETVTGESNYLLSALKNIASFYQLKSLSYNPSTKQLQFTLRDTTSGATVFPDQGSVFNSLVIKKGTEVRLTKNITDLTITRPQDADSTSEVPEATYTYDLSSLENLLKSSDSAYNDFSIEFRIVTFTGEDIWRTNILAPTTEFSLVEEGSRTYVRLNDQYPFVAGDEILLSHIVPQELIQEGSGGTPEEQTAGVQIEALRQQINALTTKVNMNESDINTLENQTADADISVYYGIVRIDGRTSGSRTNAQSTAHVGPLAVARLNLPAGRTEKTVSSLLLAGALVTYVAEAVEGYYVPIVAIKAADVTNLDVRGPGGDESSLWSGTGSSVTIGGEDYNIYMRTTPITQSKSLRVVFKDFE